MQDNLLELTNEHTPERVNVYKIPKKTDPVMPKMCVPRVLNGVGGQRGGGKVAWSLANSIFAKRAPACDGKNFYHQPVCMYVCMYVCMDGCQGLLVLVLVLTEVQ